MLFNIFATVVAVLGTVVWVGLALVPFFVAWGMWLWIRSPSDEQFEQEQAEADAFLAESEAFIRDFKAEQAAPHRHPRLP